MRVTSSTPAGRPDEGISLYELSARQLTQITHLVGSSHALNTDMPEQGLLRRQTGAAAQNE